MTPPPLPPHEREWRHPSELPAPSHEQPTPGGRLLIVATAAIGLALVGVMAIRMTPGQTARRDALVTVSTSAVLTGVSANSFGELAEAASESGRRFTDLLGRRLSSLIASTGRGASATTVLPPSGHSAPPTDVAMAVVTPIGTGGLGVTTAAAVESQTGTIEAMLPSGVVVAVELVGSDGGVAVVRLPDDSTSQTAQLAETPTDAWTVVAFGDEYSVSEERGGLHDLAVPEAAPVFDANGALVGLCTIGPDGVELLRVTSLPDVQLPPPDTSEPDSTVAVTEPTDSGDTTDSSAPGGPETSSAGSSASTVAPGTTDGPTAASSEPPNSSPESTMAP